jgi:hypothetical protein
MQKAPLVIWLLAYCSLPAVVAVFALIFAFEGFASLRSHPENVGLAVASALFLVAWPASALLGWLFLALGKTRAAWLVSAGTAAGLLLLWLLGLGLAAFAGRRP